MIPEVTPEEVLGRLRRDYPLHVQVCELQAVVARQQEEIRRLQAEIAAQRPDPLPQRLQKTREDNHTRTFAAASVPVAGRQP